MFSWTGGPEKLEFVGSDPDAPPLSKQPVIPQCRVTEPEMWGRNGASKPGECFLFKPGCSAAKPKLLQAHSSSHPCPLIQTYPSSSNVRGLLHRVQDTGLQLDKMCLPGLPFPCHAATPRTCSLHVLFLSPFPTTFLLRDLVTNQHRELQL